MSSLWSRSPHPPHHWAVAVMVATAGLVLGSTATPTDQPASAAPAASPGGGRQVGARPAEDPVLHSLAVPTTTAAAGSAARRSAAGAVAALQPVRTEPFSMLGVTWEPGTTPGDLHVGVRLHSAVGAAARGAGGGADGWGGWEDLEYDAGEAPTASEGGDVRAGTAPLWVGRADGVAVRVRSAGARPPSDVEVVTVDPGTATAARARSAAKRRPASGDTITGSPRLPRLPRIISRRQWGADRSLLNCGTSYDRTAKMVFVHHTVGANKYSARESPLIVRSILEYHTQGQGWCDIGYNALIDRFGNIYAGRRGGVRKPVHGAHAGDWNTNSVGVSLMGNFQAGEPSHRMLNALVRFVGWRLGTSFARVRGHTTVGGDRFARISGHRDAMSTLCPGGNVYHRLGRIRSRVAHYLADYSSATKRRADRLGHRTTGPVFVGEQVTHGGTYTRFAHGRMYAKHRLGAHWLAGRVLRRYRAEGGVTGALGWPRSDAHPIRSGRVRLVGFTRGRMYLLEGDPVRELHGRVLDRYRRLGAAAGRLGLPTSSIQRTHGGRKATFRHGVIRWHRRADSFTVRYR